MLPDLIDRIAQTVEGVAIDKISVIDSGGQGSGIPGVLGQLPAAVINLAEQMETATGVDILAALREADNGQLPLELQEQAPPASLEPPLT